MLGGAEGISAGRIHNEDAFSRGLFYVNVIDPDAGAPDDLSELRELLRAWRDAKRGVWRAVIEWAVRGMMAALLVGIAMRSGTMELLK